MASKTDYGKFIIAAGEVATYVTCPESWRLTHVENQDPITSTSVKIGNKLHQKWDREIQEVVHFSTGLKVVIWLVTASFLLLLVNLLSKHLGGYSI